MRNRIEKQASALSSWCRCGRSLAALTAVLWSAAALAQAPREKATLPFQLGATPVVAFSPDGKLLAVATEDSNAPVIALWDVTTGKTRGVLRGHKMAGNVGIVSLAFSADGKVLATGAGDKTIKLWDLAKGKERAPLQVGDIHPPSQLRFSADGKVLAASVGVPNDFRIKVWSLTTGKEMSSFAEKIQVGWVDLSPDGKTIAWTGDGVVKLGNAMTGKEQSSWPHEGLEKVAFSPDGKKLASANAKVKLWDVASGKELFTTPETAAARSLEFTADGTKLDVGCGTTELKIFDAAGGKELASYKVEKLEFYVRAITRDGKRVVTGNFAMGKLWDLPPIK